MSRFAEESLKETRDAKFEQILEEVRAERSGKEFSRRYGLPPGFPPSLSPDALFSIDERAPAVAGASYWEAALAWFEEFEGAVAPVLEKRAAKEESPEAILRELGLTEELTLDQIGRLRRLFMWRNHPDRLGEAERANATRRTAIANMLLDRAEARLAPARNGSSGARS